MDSLPTRHLPTYVSLAGALVISWVLATAIHESGHALMTWLSGGHVLGFYLTFLESSFVCSAWDAPQIHGWKLAFKAGGFLAGILVSTGLALAVWRHRQQQWAQVPLLTAVLAWFQNGLYLLNSLRDSPSSFVGDGHALLQLGVPPYQLALIGTLLTLGGVAWLTLVVSPTFKHAPPSPSWLAFARRSLILALLLGYVTTGFHTTLLPLWTLPLMAGSALLTAALIPRLHRLAPTATSRWRGTLAGCICHGALALLLVFVVLPWCHPPVTAPG